MNRGPWKSKYSPDTIEGYVWTDDQLKAKVMKWVNNPQSLPHLILTGAPGLGKTTLSNIISKAIAPQDTMFISASVLSGIDVVRTQINDFCSTFASSEIKIVIFDEAEKISRDAQEALRNIYDTYEDNVRFIMTCNDDGRVIEALRTRSITINFSALDKDTFYDRLFYICEQENIDFTDDNIITLTNIFDNTYPNLRAAINQLQDATGPDGKLILDVDHGLSSTITLFQNMVDKNIIDIAIIKEQLGMLSADMIESLYPYFYKCITEYSENNANKIILTSKYIAQHKNCSFPDINFCAFLIEYIGMR